MKPQSCRQRAWFTHMAAVLGRLVGLALGDSVGAAVGAGLGRGVGAADGANEGAYVFGLRVGASVVSQQ